MLCCLTICSIFATEEVEEAMEEEVAEEKEEVERRG
jgi:hypothetical protein